MRILIACEESQAVCIAMRELGHEAYSCDLQPCSGGHPEWHIQADALRRWTDPETGETQEPLVVCFCDMLANAILTPLPRKTADEIWRAMRDASAEGLRYCREDEEET